MKKELPFGKESAEMEVGFFNDHKTARSLVIETSIDSINQIAESFSNYQGTLFNITKGLAVISKTSEGSEERKKMNIIFNTTYNLTANPVFSSGATETAIFAAAAPIKNLKAFCLGKLDSLNLGSVIGFREITADETNKIKEFLFQNLNLLSGSVKENIKSQQDSSAFTNPNNFFFKEQELDAYNKIMEVEGDLKKERLVVGTGFGRRPSSSPSVKQFGFLSQAKQLQCCVIS